MPKRQSDEFQATLDPSPPVSLSGPPCYDCTTPLCRLRHEGWIVVGQDDWSFSDWSFLQTQHPPVIPASCSLWDSLFLCERQIGNVAPGGLGGGKEEVRESADRSLEEGLRVHFGRARIDRSLRGPGHRGTTFLGCLCCLGGDEGRLVGDRLARQPIPL